MNENISISDMESLCQEALKLRAEVDLPEEAAKKARGALDELNSKILFLLEAHGKTSWQTPNGNFEVRTRTSVRTPKTPEEKQLLFKWMQEKGIFWEMCSVNSQTLNALYKGELESAAQEGRDCVIPGISEPEVFKQIAIKLKR